MNERLRTSSSRSTVTPRPVTAFCSDVGSMRDLEAISRSRPITAIGGIGPVLNISTETIPTRPVQDENYFIALLKKKEASIQIEMRRIREQLERLEMDLGALPSLKDAHKVASHEVTNLEHTLSDYSLAVENMRRRVDPYEIQTTTRHILIENEALCKEIDGLFLQRQKLTREIEQLENNLNDKHVHLLHYFTNPSKREIYLQLLSTLSTCDQEKKHLEHVIRQLMEKKRLLLSESQLADKHKREYSEACNEVEKLKTELSAIDDALVLLQMNPEDALSLLTEKLQNEKSRLCALDEEAVLVDANYQMLLTRKQALANRYHEFVQERDNTKTWASQYSTLVETNTAYSQQLEELQNEIDKTSHEQSSLRSHVVELLTDISKNIERYRDAAPTEIEAQKIKEVLGFKEKNVVKNLQTVDRLKYQREKRASEVKKSEELEDKIHEELRSLSARMEKMNQEMNLYDDIKSLQETYDSSNDYLLQMKERYQQRYDFMSLRVKQLEKDLDQLEGKLRSNDVWNELRDLKEKVRQDNETVYSMQQLIKNKSKETDYSSASSICLEIVDALNSQLLSYYNLE